MTVFSFYLFIYVYLYSQASNKRRNRYLDVPCLDSTAVELSDNTYIHANWVDGYQCPRAYILAQGKFFKFVFIV